MHALLFDIDGTLILSGGAGKAAMEAALADVFDLKHPADGVPYSGRTDRAIVSDIFCLFGIADTEENHLRVRAVYLEHLPRELAARKGRILPGVEALLAELERRDDVAVGLLTGNVSEAAQLKLKRFAIDHHFAFGGYGDVHADRALVAQDALTAASEHLGSAHCVKQTWVIGDTPLDVACARAIGARVVAVATGVHDIDELAATEPDVVLPDLEQVEHLLKLWA